MDGLTTTIVGNAERVRECHGTLRTARCGQCGQASAAFWSAARRDSVAMCAQCGGVVRPDVVMFGEGLPEAFTRTQFDDLRAADLLLVCGTSLSVYPFAGLVSAVGDLVPRALFNRDAVGCFAKPDYRDVVALGDIDERIAELVGLLGWQTELDAVPATVTVLREE